MRDDRDPNLYLAVGADPNYASVGYLAGTGVRGSGTLISSSYVLTAAHVMKTPTMLTFNVSGGSSLEAWADKEPNWKNSGLESDYDWDIAVVRLSELVLTVRPAVLYTDTDEVGKQGTLVGYGCRGTGLTGQILDTQGTKRGGQNLIDRTGQGYRSHTTRMLFSDFDNPSNPLDSRWEPNTPLDLECLAADKDSGGGVFIIDANGPRLGGVATVVIIYGDPNKVADYGDVMGMTRVSSFRTWITNLVETHYQARWTAGSGALNTAGNWQTMRDGNSYSIVPGPADVALFDGNGTYTVTWPAGSVTNDRLRVRQGNVTFNLSGRTYTVRNDPNYEPSVVVGDSGGAAGLTISNGTLSSRHAFVGPNSADNAAVTVSSAGAAWNSTGSVYVGGSDANSGGTGLLAVGSGGAVNVSGAVKVWPGGTVDMSGGNLAAGQVLLAGGSLRGWGSVTASMPIGTDTIQVSSGTLSLSGQLSISSGGTLTKSGAGTLAVNSLQSHAAGASLAVDGGEVHLNTDAGGDGNHPDFNLTIDVNGSGVNLNSTQHLAGLNVNQGSAKVSLGGARVVVTKALAIDANVAYLDLADNDLVVDYAAGSNPMSQVLDWIRTGYADAHWTGKGITSSAAANDANQRTALGVLDNALYGYDSFSGQTVDSTSILVKYTWYGDADLNGEVSYDDYLQWEGGLGGSGTGWLYGDFDYNGEVNYDDYLLWEGGLGGQTAILSEGFAAMAAVPEPATVMLVGAGILTLVRRRARSAAAARHS